MKPTRQDRIDWLLSNQGEWNGYPKTVETRTRNIIEKMQQDGVLSSKTRWYDVRLEKLIWDARRQRRLRRIRQLF